MYKLISEAEAVGKTVEKVSHDGEFMSILFTDDTAVVTKAAFGWHKEYCEMLVEETTEDISLSDLLSLDILTQEEYNEIHEAEEKKWAEEYAKKERAEYERLKKIYED